ncbi:MAG: hypothetical protein H0W30_15820 [Gemmatimonadaceae bacterium]|nr:hypothetical protein [Gemmatimonadaceae bacterium]MDQ3517803.1 hypothetical protein [Gemmatimonadota bacterium]
MALKPCRECGREVSAQANTCPHCGVSAPANNALAAAGALQSLQSCGCLMTLLITIPIVLVILFVLLA